VIRNNFALRIHSIPQTKMIGVIGNEACDADSIVCAIAMATWKNYCPFLHIPIEDLDSRLDFSSICEIAKISDPIRTFSTRSLVSDYSDITGWILVDHNDPLPNIFPVVEIIDHHEIVSESARLVLAKVPNQIEPVGSCATLVAERILLDAQFCESEIGHQILHLLVLTIILDTQNFSVSLGKTTLKDRLVVELISKHLKVDSATLTNSFECMRDAKFNPQFWYGVGNEEKILKYDYKQFVTSSGEVVGISTILREIDTRLMEVIGRLKGDRRLSVVGAGYRKNGQLESQLFIVGDLDEKIYEQLVARFQLEELHRVKALCDPSVCSSRLFQVHDKTFSRKKFAPVLLRCMDEHISPS